MNKLFNEALEALRATVNEGKKKNPFQKALAKAFITHDAKTKKKSYPPGTTRKWKNGEFVKQADGSWKPVSDSGSKVSTPPPTPPTKRDWKFLSSFGNQVNQRVLDFSAAGSFSLGLSINHDTKTFDARISAYDAFAGAGQELARKKGFSSKEDAEGWIDGELGKLKAPKAEPAKPEAPKSAGAWTDLGSGSHKYVNNGIEARIDPSDFIPGGGGFFDIEVLKLDNSTHDIHRVQGLDKAKRLATDWADSFAADLKKSDAKPGQAPTLDTVAAAMKHVKTRTGGGMKVSIDNGQYPGIHLDPENRQRLDHYVGKHYRPGPDEDPEGWDSEGWEDEYAGPLAAEIEKALKDKGFDTAKLDIDVGEKGHVYIQIRR